MWKSLSFMRMRLPCSLCISHPTHSVTKTHALVVTWQSVLTRINPTRTLFLSNVYTCNFHDSGIADLETRLQITPSLDLIDASNNHTESIMHKDMLVFENFISPEEENCLFEEVQPYLKKLRYEYDHWDDAIHGYRETEKRQWSEKSNGILQRVRDLAFPPGTPQLAFVHVLDLAKAGHIKAHIDSTRFCGSTIAGLSLLSDCVMRLVHDKDKSSYADVLLNRRSLYIMRNQARFEYTHEVLPETDSKFCGNTVVRDRRISVICRCEPSDDPYTEPGS